MLGYMSRIRLYRMAINKHYAEITQDFNIYTSEEGKNWVAFEPNTENPPILIQRKI